MEVVEFACGLGHLTKGAYSENVSTGIDVYTLRQPLGVVGIISPFNFPAMVPLWFFSIALAAGNAVILKPSEKDPSAANWMAALLKEAGLPDGVLNVVHGDKEAVDALLEHPDVRAISFVGSTPIARYVYETATGHGKRVQALGGAKNHMLVLPDADLDLAADAAVNAGFGSAGERCMAISVVLAVDTIADELVEKVAERMATLTHRRRHARLRHGPAHHAASTATRSPSYIDVAGTDGASVVVDGRDVELDGDPDGFWLGPTLIDKVPTSSAVYKDEIFGPVLSVVRVDGYEEGLGIINSSLYGNGTAIFTNDGGAARRFQREVHGRHDRHQRADPGAGGVPLVRRLEGLAVRRREGLRPARLRLLHGREGDHRALARPVARRPEPGVPAARLSGRSSARFVCASLAQRPVESHLSLSEERRDETKRAEALRHSHGRVDAQRRRGPRRTGG